jgi:Kindlin-2 N-terminal domain
MIHVGDNTWNIRVMITDLQVEKTLRVKGDLHIGGVMLKLSKTEGESSLSVSLGIPLWFRNQSSATPHRSAIKIRSMNQIFFLCLEQKSLGRKIHNLTFFFTLKITQSHMCVGCWFSQYARVSSLSAPRKKK